LNRLVRGIGINSKEYPTSNGNKDLKEYKVWTDMLGRCTENVWVKHPSYIGVTCSDNFKHYSFFYEWCQTQIGFRNRDEKDRYWHLDKDLLVKGNKIYNEDVCVFLPQKVNNLLLKRDIGRGSNVIGVYWNEQKRKFISQCSNGSGIQKHLGGFETWEEAFLTYKTFKESYIKQVTNEFKEHLDPRAYQALLNYEVEITD